MTKFYVSTRFWSLVLASVVYMLNSYGLLPVELANALYVVFAGSISVRTLDRFSENVGKKK